MKLLLAFSAICRLIVAVGLVTMGRPTTTNELTDTTTSLNLTLSVNPADLAAAARDFGGTAVSEPTAVLYPETADDVARMVRAAYESEAGWAVSARGHGHSVNGQAQVPGKLTGVVVQMSRGLRMGRPRTAVEGMYVDAWGGDMWADVLRATLEYGLAPKSWTDYLYLTVGGTLSNAGISGQAFNHGPQISNVLQMDVVTGKGEILACTKEENSELFHGVLGGLGQFGIITRARIALEPAPQRVRWIRVLYSNFTAFTEDQEHLISLHVEPARKKFDYVEGFVIVDEGLINNWRSSFFSPQNPVNISSLFGGAGRGGGGGGVLYCLEITKNYFHSSDPDTVNQEIETLMKRLRYIPGSEFTSDVSYVDFLDRVHKAELKLRSKGLWDVPHPWLNLFVPKSKISEFDRGVFKGILGNKTSGPILIYPMNKNKFDDRVSAVTPDENVFYLVALLRSALKGGDEMHTLEYLQNQNARILKFCRESGIDVKHYLPHYTTPEEWMNHFGSKWGQFKRLKMRYDPRHILASGQRIFTPSLGGNLATS
ncbi:Cytokinin dehydrogenase 5-like protein [Drosera capensis]